MRFRGLVSSAAALLLLAGMFIAVHRGANGRQLGERIAEIADRQAAADVTSGELRREIEELRSRGRIVRAGEGLGLRLPSEDEFVILDLGARPAPSAGGSR